MGTGKGTLRMRYQLTITD